MAQAPSSRGGRGRGVSAEAQLLPVLEGSIPDGAAEPVPRFFTPTQFSTLRKLAEVLVPPLNGKPGAIEACAPEFIDYLVSVWPARQKLYRTGLDDLAAKAKSKFQKTFPDLDASQVDSLIKPLFVPLAEERSALVLGPFMNRVHEDLRTAAMNSLEWAEASSDGSVVARPGLYWLRVDPTVIVR